MDSSEIDSKKSHQKSHSGRKAQKKKNKEEVSNEGLTDKQRNPKAFAFNSAIRAERRFRRKQDLDTNKLHVPLVDRTPDEPPPILIAVVGPPKVGKSTLINNLIKLFTRAPLVEMKGPVTIVTGKKRRITFIECNNDVNSMIDLAKVADLALLLCDASFGFEMEVFEFLNICQVHGMPKIMGVLTHLDMIKNVKTLKTTKKTLKHRFWTEVYPGAKLFYLSGIIHDEYLRNEIQNLGRFISVMKFRPLTWRINHGYLLGDRYEDLTNQELIRQNFKCDRNIALYGYVRGAPIKNNCSIHIAGLGDLKVHDISFLSDPCPLPDQIKKRALIEKEKLIYAPFSGVGGIVYDKDAVYVDLGGSHSHNKRPLDETDNIVTNLIDAKKTIDVKMAESRLQLFTGGHHLTADDFQSDDDEAPISKTQKDDQLQKDDQCPKNDLTDEKEDDLSEINDEGSDDSNNEMDGIKWKENLAEKAKDSFFTRLRESTNLMKLIYGVFDIKKQSEKSINENNGVDDEEDIGGLFKKVSQNQQKLKLDKDSMDLTESSLMLPWNATTKDWLDPHNKMLISNCFVTGSWKPSEDANQFLSKEDKVDEESEADDDEFKKQSLLNKSVFNNMADDVRVQIEGFRPGMYVRIEIENVPAEFVTNFDASYPIVVGALNTGEENIGYVNVKIKKHRWYSKILKNTDPIIVSLGWRRFQTIPVYSKLEDDLKYRYLKYTPEHMACNAHFWGPITPPGTGFLALQSVESNPEIISRQGFRIAATGVVQELDKSTQIQKKLKLIGYPMKIYKKTAFIKGMFNSSLEVARFEGGRLKTVSGIRGQIKKAINKPEGCFRATFEDKILLSDIVFCRTWYKVDVPEFYNPVTTLLLPHESKNSWRGVRTTGAIKREKGIQNNKNKDSLYVPIHREIKPFKPLVVPRKLQKILPYRDKPKHAVTDDDKKKVVERVTVIREPREQKVSKLMQKVKVNYEHKVNKMKEETQQRLKKHAEATTAADAVKSNKLKLKKKEVFRKRSKAATKK